MKRIASIDQWRENLVIVRGGGDIATGTIYKLFQCGFPLLVLEIARPSCIRRTISFCMAVTKGTHQVEGITARRVEDPEEAFQCYRAGEIPVMIDENASMISILKPMAVVDGILAKRNLGTTMNDAPVVIGIGPGFTAGEDVHAVIETKRGHNLGRVIYEGPAAPNSGIPGLIMGYGKERVIHAPATGKLHMINDIGSVIKQGDVVAEIITQEGEEIPVRATLTGLIRGMIEEGYPVVKGFKIADIDPRADEINNCYTISDKARCVAGGVIEALMHLKEQ